MMKGCECVCVSTDLFVYVCVCVCVCVCVWVVSVCVRARAIAVQQCVCLSGFCMCMCVRVCVCVCVFALLNISLSLSAQSPKTADAKYDTNDITDPKHKAGVKCVGAGASTDSASDQQYLHSDFLHFLRSQCVTKVKGEHCSYVYLGSHLVPKLFYSQRTLYRLANFH